jgi:hypothetical protein
MDAALLRSERLVFHFRGRIVRDGDEQLVGSFDGRFGTRFRDEQGAILWTSRRERGFLRREKRLVLAADDDTEIGYVSGSDLCDPDGRLLARVPSGRDYCRTYDIVDVDECVVARVARGRSVWAFFSSRVPWELDLPAGTGSTLRTLIIANIPQWTRGYEDHKWSD